MEKYYLHKGGGVIWADMNLTLVRDLDGNPLLSVGTMRDITAQRQAEAELRELNADLEARVERRTADLARETRNLEAFSYSVSHDLRAPLRGLSGFSELLLEEYGDRLDETGRGYATRIAAASERRVLLHPRCCRPDISVSGYGKQRGDDHLNAATRAMVAAKLALVCLPAVGVVLWVMPIYRGNRGYWARRYRRPPRCQ